MTKSWLLAILTVIVVSFLLVHLARLEHPTLFRRAAFEHCQPGGHRCGAVADHVSATRFQAEKNFVAPAGTPDYVDPDADPMRLYRLARNYHGHIVENQDGLGFSDVRMRAAVAGAEVPPDPPNFSRVQDLINKWLLVPLPPEISRDLDLNVSDPPIRFGK